MNRWPALLLALAVSLALPQTASAGSRRVDEADRAFWENIRNSNNPADYRAYLRGFPNGRYVGMADARLAELEQGRNYDRPDRDPRSGPDAYGAPLPLTGAPPPRYASVPGPTGVKLTVMPVYRAGDPVAIRFDNLPPGVHDIQIFPVSSRGLVRRQAVEAKRTRPYVRNARVSSTGQITFPPLRPGIYEARVFLANRYTARHRPEIAARAEFEVR